MKDLEHANLLYSMACKDLKALKGMEDKEIFDDEIFGFHVQQATEKALKAWLASLGVEYPKTHDLSLLLRLLEEQGIDVEKFWELVDYNIFAVQFRYEAFDLSTESIDRSDAIRQTTNLLKQVAEILGQNEIDESDI